MKRSAIVTIAAALIFLASAARNLQAQTVAVAWDGGDGAWESAKWNGGQTAATVFGDNRMSNGAFAVTIDDGDVFYNAGDLRDFRPGKNVGNTSITIKDGASLELNSNNTDVDGVWTQYDADLILDGGTFKRTLTPGGSSESGGLMMLGSWRSVQDQDINVVIKNGGSLQNDGQIWFGADEEHALGLKVFWQINNGTVDLTGGAYPQSNNDNIVVADLAFFYGTDIGDGDGATTSLEPKGEHYEINFIGPGSLTVDQSGIYVYEQDNIGLWTSAQQTYEDLWNRGILRSHGINGKTGTAFTNFFTVTGASGSDNYTVTAKTPTVVTWDGGNADWGAGTWNGGQTASAVMGNNRGGDGGHQIVIGGGAQVTYDANTHGDFRPQMLNGPTELVIKEGALVSLDSINSDVDGKWTEFDADLTLDNGTLRRTASGASESGGILMFGSWRSIQDQEIRVNIRNGGRIENDGQLWFGADEDHALGLKVLFEINDGHLDLTGGDYPQANSDNIVTAEMAFFVGTDIGEGDGASTSLEPKGETYQINFTGPGSITVDESGIWLYKQDEIGLWTGNQVTYQDLWSEGILQANGLSGVDGAAFNDFFSVTGASGSANYMLTSLLSGGGGGGGDFDGDGDVDGADFLVWQRGGSPNPGSSADLDAWKAGFGNGSPAKPTVGAVPEPSSLAVALFALGGLAAGRLRRRCE